MPSIVRKTFAIFNPGGSLRRRIAYSLAIVRLILVPVIFLAVYYLFEMGWIVDRIVSVDAPAATLAQQASIQMLEARRAERNYFLLHDPSFVRANADSLKNVVDILNKIAELEPEDAQTIQDALNSVNLYQQRFATTVASMQQPGRGTLDRIQAVVRDYEKDLNTLVKNNERKSRAELVDQLRDQVGSFDTQIANTVQAIDPSLRQATAELETTSHRVFDLTTTLESENWQRVQDDHRDTKLLLHRAEWVLSIVSAIVLLLSIWISYILPREVVKPLISLKEAVDHAASGNYQIEFELQGKGEVVDLARSVQHLIAHITQLRQTA